MAKQTKKPVIKITKIFPPSKESVEKCHVGSHGDIEEAGGYAVFDILGPDGQMVQLPYSGESDLAALQTGIRGIFAYSQQMNNAAYCVMHDLGIEK